MGSKFYKLSVTHGTNLLRVAKIIKMPEKVGEKKFSSNVRATLNKKIRVLYKTLKKLSPLTDQDKLCFGPIELWRKKERTFEECATLAKSAGVPVEDVDRVIYEAKDWNIEVDARLSADARDGLYWMLFMWCHPESPMCQGAGAQDSLVWPLAEQLRCVKALEKDTGLDANETMEVKYDDEEESSEETKEEEKEEEPVLKEEPAESQA
jgi:hypothetical protein